MNSQACVVMLTLWLGKVFFNNRKSFNIQPCVLHVRFVRIGLRFTIAKQFEKLCE